MFIPTGNNVPYPVYECLYTLSRHINMLSYQIKEEGMQASSKAYWGQNPKAYPVGTP